MMSKKELKLKWLKENLIIIVFMAVCLGMIFACAIIFHKLWLVVVGIVIGFASYFYGLNKLLSYIESELHD